MDQHSTDTMRIGSRVDDAQQLSNLRKMLIFKGAAYNQASGEIPNILASKSLSKAFRRALSQSSNHSKSSVLRPVRLLSNERN